ncbi:hypothetical protein ACFL5Z_21230, partial [Planctomycetota bacterium]
IQVGPSLLYQNRYLLATSDMIFEPCFYCICQIYSFSAEVNPRQTVRTFKVLDDVSVVPRVADLRDSEKPDQFLLCHDTGTRDEFTIWAW